ncbi:hypothetical protein GOQ30_07995 [Flavobacterium sp. TP390]|uniref:C1q domain-containing protein n=1 Tax=Flavobacterium profundi TaxID=1774945 RepID=A0A6I4ISJ5_9FLAO|nr:hypothetical protein [Flavobacterium profundi]MVO09107.1 hypothetical protein [Flavobacterium profundi]
MIKKITATVFTFLCSFLVNAQVGIGTTSPSPSSLLELNSTTQTFVPPRMTNSQMQAISNPLIGSVIYNTSDDALYMRTNLGWQNISRTSNPTISLNKNFPGADTVIATQTNTYANFPLNSADVIANTSSVYSVTGNGQITINESGTYLMNAAFSVENVPSGTRKFVIGIYKNGTLVGYPTRGTIVLSGEDTWGSSGTLVENFSVGDVVTFKYVLNNNGTPLDALNFNIGITKLK